MFNCALKYKILGHPLRNICVVIIEATGNKLKMTVTEKQKYFQQDLRSAIKSHQKLREY